MDQQSKEALPMGRSVESAQAISGIISMMVFFGGWLVLAGWIFDVQTLKSVCPDLVTMKANTALCFVLTGLALWCLQSKRTANKNLSIIIGLCNSLIIFVGLATLGEYIYHWDLGIDQLLFKELGSPVLTSSPGRMAFYSAFNFVLIGIILFFLRQKNTKFIYGIQILALTMGFTSILALISYGYGAVPFYLGGGFSTAVSVHAAIIFILVTVGILFLRPDHGMMSNITCDLTGGKLLRRLLPVAIMVPISVGFLEVIVQKMHLFSSEFGVSVVAISSVFVIAIYIYFLSVLLNRADTKRRFLEESTVEAKNNLEKKSQELELALKEALLGRKIMTSMLDDNNNIREDLEKRLQELKQSQNMLIHSEKLAALGRLVSEITHEINNPLMIISGYAQLSLMAKTLNDEQKKNLNIIVEECQRAKDVAIRVLRFSKLSQGDLKEVNINQYVEAVISIVERQFLAISNVEIKRKYFNKPIHVFLDDHQMNEVFMNLLNNAKEAMPGGGVITVTTSVEGAYLRINFEDNGVGMTEETLRRITEPYFTTKETGTGIGLGVCHGIIKAHNGELTYTSELGKGTLVSVWLPLGGKQDG